MPRSLKKGPFVDLSLSKKVDKAIANNIVNFKELVSKKGNS